MALSIDGTVISWTHGKSATIRQSEPFALDTAKGAAGQTYTARLKVERNGVTVARGVLRLPNKARESLHGNDGEQSKAIREAFKSRAKTGSLDDDFNLLVVVDDSGVHIQRLEA